MRKAISEIVGSANLDQGGSSSIYVALRDLLCATCGAEIAEGSLFTRRKLRGIGLRILPQCRECIPFTLPAATEKKSPLLRSLMAVSTPEPSNAVVPRPRNSVPENSDAQRNDAKKLDEALKRRLGPALRRGRQRQK